MHKTSRVKSDNDLISVSLELLNPDDRNHHYSPFCSMPLTR